MPRSNYQEIVVVEFRRGCHKSMPVGSSPLEASAKQMLIELEEELEPSGRDLRFTERPFAAPLGPRPRLSQRGLMLPKPFSVAFPA